MALHGGESNEPGELPPEIGLDDRRIGELVVQQLIEYPGFPPFSPRPPAGLLPAFGIDVGGAGF